MDRATPPKVHRAPPSTGLEEESSRKKVRKGTKSCWECKRRKIKCSLAIDPSLICSNCRARGTTCLSQEHPEQEHHAASSSQSSSNLVERLGRVESLLERLVGAVDMAQDERHRSAGNVAEDAVRTPESASWGTGDVAVNGEVGFEDAPKGTSLPILSLFDPPVIGHRESTSQSQADTPSTATEASLPKSLPSRRTHSQLDRLREALMALFPSQRDTDIICKASNCSVLIEGMCPTTTETARLEEEVSDLSCFNLAKVAKDHPTAIGRTLLYVAVGLQQLPPGFDTTQLNIELGVEALMSKIIVSVQALITSEDELVASCEGLDCLMVQGLYHLNAGSLRRSWLTFRRALNVAQLMGIHRKVEYDAPPEARRGNEQWHKLVQADRYLGLLLGLPCGTTDDVIEPHETFDNPQTDHDKLFKRRLALIASRIIERNQSEHTAAFAKTQQIDEQLEQLAKEVSSEWWTVPATVPNARPSEMAKVLDKVMTQIWYFQLESLLHLPFMLKASTERRYEYSRFSCLKAAREMVWKYLALRSLSEGGLCCKVIDFTAFTGVIMLLLQLLDPTQQKEGQDNVNISRQIEMDHHLVKSVLASMEERATGGKDAIALQSVTAIKTILEIKSSSSRASNNLRLNIPFFGTLSIIRSPVSTSTRDDPTPASTIETSEPRRTNSTGSSPLNLELLPPQPSRSLHEADSSALPVSLQNSQALPTPHQAQNWHQLHHSSSATPAIPSTSFPIVNFTSSQFQFQPDASIPTFTPLDTVSHSSHHYQYPSPASIYSDSARSLGPQSMVDRNRTLNGAGSSSASGNMDQSGNEADVGMQNAATAHASPMQVDPTAQDTLFFDSLLESDLEAGWIYWNSWKGE